MAKGLRVRTVVSDHDWVRLLTGGGDERRHDSPPKKKPRAYSYGTVVPLDTIADATPTARGRQAAISGECRFCGRELTDAVSVSRGCGPVCEQAARS